MLGVGVGVGVSVEGRLVRIRDGDVPPTEDLPVCRFQRDGGVLQKREDQSVSGSRAAIVSLVQSVHRARGGGRAAAAEPGSEQSRAEGREKRGRHTGGGRTPYRKDPG